MKVDPEDTFHASGFRWCNVNDHMIRPGQQMTRVFIERPGPALDVCMPHAEELPEPEPTGEPGESCEDCGRPDNDPGGRALHYEGCIYYEEDDEW